MRCLRNKRPVITIELIPDTEQGGFTARMPDIPAYGEGETEEEAIADLKEGLLCFIEVYGIEEALRCLGEAPTLRSINVELSEFVGV